MRRRRGVTLIEVAVVMVVIGVLAAIAIPRYWHVRERAYLSSVQSDLRSFATQQELYYDRHQEYAGSVALLPDFRSSSGVTVSITSAAAGGWAATGLHSGLAAQQCGLYYGTATAASAPPATQAGVIACN